MNNFNDREKGFERKYAHDEETNFKIIARRNKLLGLWAAGKLGKSGADAEAYAKEVVAADFEHEGDDDVMKKVALDFQQADVSLSAQDVRGEMERLLPIARQQISGKNG